MSDHASPSAGLYSRFNSDPDLREIVELFVAEMPGRVAEILDCLETDDRRRLRTLAHQLKGAGASYGFDAITARAAELERHVAADSSEEQIRRQVAALVDICRQARSGASPR